MQKDTIDTHRNSMISLNSIGNYELHSFLCTEAYHKFLEAYGLGDSEARTRAYLQLFSQLPQNPNQACIVFLMEHLVR